MTLPLSLRDFFSSVTGVWFDGSRGKKLCGSVILSFDKQISKGRAILCLLAVNLQLLSLFCNSSGLVDIVGELLGVVSVDQQ
ncbi:unnamed protein product [Citrullus colocynthis]|uniref:Uncharacterized protein n=1 Tax=Citrullus colocynthis TaxID=252529 RepID=A0ABP0Y548_9ROSI